MKKFTALLLIFATMTGCLVTGCENRSNRRERDRSRDREEEEEDDEEDEDPRHDSRNDLVRPSVDNDDPPLYITEGVDVTQEFDPVSAEPVDTPWVLANNIPFTTANVINTHFYEVLMDPTWSYEIESDILNDTATIQRPIVRHYPAEDPEYTVYEISYSEYFHTRAVVPDQNYTFTWTYHDVNFVDYYTGTVYPVINLSSDIESFCVYGDVTYENETYTIYYYSYRDCVPESDEVVTDDDGRQVREYDMTIYYTNYFIVPNGYDGIVMCIYTAYDEDMTFEEMMEGNTHYFEGPHIFGEPGYDEAIEDYAFLNIVELG